jgi:large subunit ribosomal protein L30
MAAKLRVTLRKSPISYTARARATVRSLGLHRIGQTVEVVDDPATRGMIRAVEFLVVSEPAEGSAGAPAKATGKAPARHEETEA